MATTTTTPFGGWGKNPATGKTERFWGGNVWTSGEDPTGGKGVNWQQQQAASQPASQSSGGSSSAPAIDWESMVKSQADARNAFANTQAQQSQDLLTKYQNTIGGQESVGAMAGRLGNELGLPSLQKSAFDINQNLSAIPQTQTQATRGYDVNANQLQRIIASKQAELAPAAQTATAQAQNAQQQLNTQMGYEQAQQAKELLPFQTEINMLSDRQAREATGFNTQQQNELSMLLQKIDSQQTLTAAETARTQQLADAETKFTQQKELLTMQTNEAIRQSKATTGATTDISKYLTGGTTSNAPAAASGFVPDTNSSAPAANVSLPPKQNEAQAYIQNLTGNAPYNPLAPTGSNNLNLGNVTLPQLQYQFNPITGNLALPNNSNLSKLKI